MLQLQSPDLKKMNNSSCLSVCNAAAPCCSCFSVGGTSPAVLWTWPRFRVEQFLGNLQKLTQVGGSMGQNLGESAVELLP